MSVPPLVGERVVINGEHHPLERIHHYGPHTQRIRVVWDLHLAARSRAVAERLTPGHGWTVLAELPPVTGTTPPLAALRPPRASVRARSRAPFCR